jgi:hypothetical protein
MPPVSNQRFMNTRTSVVFAKCGAFSVNSLAGRSEAFQRNLA